MMNFFSLAYFLITKFDQIVLWIIVTSTTSQNWKKKKKKTLIIYMCVCSRYGVMCVCFKLFSAEGVQSSKLLDMF